MIFEQEQEPEPIDNVIPIASDAPSSSSPKKPAAGRLAIPAAPDFFFCGGQSVTGVPYCSYHSRVAYQPAGDRRRDRPPFRAE